MNTRLIDSIEHAIRIRQPEGAAQTAEVVDDAVTMAVRVMRSPGTDAAAIYVGGELAWVGHDCDLMEGLIKVFGLTEEYTDAFMRGQGQWSAAAQSLDEVPR